jgi:hypothetical protein
MFIQQQPDPLALTPLCIPGAKRKGLLTATCSLLSFTSYSFHLSPFFGESFLESELQTSH